MITTNTVLVLGAGASAPYGFPTGDKLVWEILHLAEKEESHLQVCAGRLLYQQGELEEFARRLRMSKDGSIDAFIEARIDEERTVNIGKMAIAVRLLSHSNYATLHFDRPNNQDWYRKLWKDLSTGAATPEAFGENKLSVVTYNYDLSFEVFFREAIQNHYRCDDETLKAVRIPVLHLHGSLADCQSARGRQEPGEGDLHQVVAHSISLLRVIHEGELTEEYQQAHDLISRAESVALIGFGFHEVNIERLALAEHMTTGQLTGTSYGYGKADLERAVDLIKTDNFHVHEEWFHELNALEFLEEVHFY